jgi:hypothetical protein
MGWVVNVRPRPLYPRERPGTHYIGGWVGPRDFVTISFKTIQSGMFQTENSRSVCEYKCKYIDACQLYTLDTVALTSNAN